VPEQEFHEIQALAAGVPAARQVSFGGQPYRLARPALPPLIRYILASRPPQDPALTAGQADRQHGTAILAASHRLLQDTLDPAAWDGFAAAALAGKAGMDQITGVLRAVVEENTAWKYWPAMRLLGWLTQNLPERDGVALAAGRGLAEMSPRQACNAAYATLLAGQENPEARDTFIEDLMFEGNPEGDAMAAVRAMQRAQQAQQEEAAGGG
jgi:hypothetical protein